MKDPRLSMGPEAIEAFKGAVRRHGLQLLNPAPSLMYALTLAFPDIDRRRPADDQIHFHVVWWLHAWGDESEDRVRRLVDIHVGGYPKIGVQIVARDRGGDLLLAKVRAAGGLLDMDEHGARTS